VQSVVLKFERQRNKVERKPDFKIQAIEGQHRGPFKGLDFLHTFLAMKKV